MLLVEIRLCCVQSCSWYSQSFAGYSVTQVHPPSAAQIPSWHQFLHQIPSQHTNLQLEFGCQIITAPILPFGRRVDANDGFAVRDWGCCWAGKPDIPRNGCWPGPALRLNISVSPYIPIRTSCCDNPNLGREEMRRGPVFLRHDAQMWQLSLANTSLPAREISYQAPM